MKEQDVRLAADAAKRRALTRDIQAAEVAWYRKNGRYRSRIKLDGRGDFYVIGDFSWNRGDRPREYVDGALEAVVTNSMGERLKEFETA